MRTEMCRLCGHDPACGHAEINGLRYCHGDWPCWPRHRPVWTCYEQAQRVHESVGAYLVELGIES